MIQMDIGARHGRMLGLSRAKTVMDVQTALMLTEGCRQEQVGEVSPERESPRTKKTC